MHVDSFITGGVFDCNIAHRRSVAVLCMLYKIRCKPMHPPYDALLVPYVPGRVLRGALVAHRYTSAPPHCRPSHYRRTLISLLVSLWNDLEDPYSMVGTSGFQDLGQCFFIDLTCSYPFLSPTTFSISLLSVYWLVLWGWGLWIH